MPTKFQKARPRYVHLFAWTLVGTLLAATAQASDDACDRKLNGMTMGACMMQEQRLFTGDIQHISRLMQIGNVTVNTRRSGERCFADVRVQGTVRGASYSEDFSCRLN